MFGAVEVLQVTAVKKSVFQVCCVTDVRLTSSCLSTCTTLSQIDLHKDDILLKDQELVREHFDHHKVEKEKEGIVSETLRVTRQISSSEEILIAQAAENVKLITVVARADEERARQSKEYRAVITERDSLRAQVVQRDAELTSLYEKIKIQRSTLDKSASTFSRQKAAQHALVTTIQDLKSELQHIKLQVLYSCIKRMHTKHCVVITLLCCVSFFPVFRCRALTA